jgi:Putative prokaryotic signal transducing protein
MSHEFVVLTEYYDDFEAQMVQSSLFDADIDAELELERSRGMKASSGNPVIKIMVRPHDLERARKLLKKGRKTAGLDDEPDMSDLDAAQFGSSDNVQEV